jgi:hypothetical protein
MTNVMHKFLIYLYIYFCLTCFGLSFSPSSAAGVQLRQWFKSAGYGVSARAKRCYVSPKLHSDTFLKKTCSAKDVFSSVMKGFNRLPYVFKINSKTIHVIHDCPVDRLAEG